MQQLYLAIQLLQVLCLGYGALTHSRYNQLYPEDSVAHLDAAGNGESMKSKRQTSKSWRVGTFSECSVTCGGGLRARLVRCLNEDGVISDDCSPSERPASFKFCNQIDCATKTFNSFLFPAPGTYTFTSGESTSVLQFNNRGTGSYVVQLNTTESDGTGTTLLQTVNPHGTTTQFSRTANMNMTRIVNSGGNFFLELGGVNILNLDKIERTDVASDESISNAIFMGSHDSVDVLVYFDGFRYYTFTTYTVNPLNGPGTLYYNSDTLEALFSIDSSLNKDLDEAIQSSMTAATRSKSSLHTRSNPYYRKTHPHSKKTSYPRSSSNATLSSYNNLSSTCKPIKSSVKNGTISCKEDSYRNQSQKSMKGRMLKNRSHNRYNRHAGGQGDGRGVSRGGDLGGGRGGGRRGGRGGDQGGGQGLSGGPGGGPYSGGDRGGG